MKRILKSFIGILFFCLILFHFIFGYYFIDKNIRSVFEIRNIPLKFREYQVSNGESLNSILSRLENNDLAPNAIWIKLAMKLKKKEFLVKKGKYMLNENMSTWEILEIFDLGRVELIHMTLREGLNIWETAEELGKTQWGNKEQFLNLIEEGSRVVEWDSKATDLEGFLFPETYTFEPQTSPEKIIETILQQFKEKVLPDLNKAQSMGLNLREWITLASMVEKEAGRDAERARIAGVFMNRRKRGMLYQCDPTIVYALKKEGRYRGKIYRSDLKFKSPYNTYVVSSLPPGPIASPGFESLKSVIDHEIHEYLFFVAKNDGTHHFSKTLAEHNRYVRKYQR